MGKYVYAVLLALLIEFGLFLFGGTEYANSSLFAIINEPILILKNPFYLVIEAAIAIFIGAKIVPGNFIELNTYGVYAGVAFVSLTFLLSIVHLWSFMNAQIGSAISESFAQIVTAVVVIPLVVFYAVSTIEWVRAN